MTTPTAPAERIEIVDVLRGFALFGILCINIFAIANPGSPPGFQFRGSWGDTLIYGLIIALVESKFFTLFSSLFGLGFAIQLLSAERRGENLIPRFRRRLLALGAFGIAHIVLLWDGDILLLYALVGFILLLFRKKSQAQLLAWIGWLLAVPLTLYTVVFVGLGVARAFPESAAALAGGDQEFARSFAEATVAAAQKYANGDYLSLLLARVEGYTTSFALLFTRIPTVLAMFLLGLYVGRSGILQRPSEHLELLRRVRRWGWTLGLPLAVLVAIGYLSLPPLSAIVVLLFNQALVGVLLSMAYASSLVLWVVGAAPRWAVLLGNVGRTALSNYLGQSLICGLIFNGYGLGLAGKLAPGSIVLCTLAIFAAQILLSTLWLGRFRFGLLEWLWRSLTYGKVQPLLR